MPSMHTLTEWGHKDGLPEAASAGSSVWHDESEAGRHVRRDKEDVAHPDESGGPSVGSHSQRRPLLCAWWHGRQRYQYVNKLMITCM